MPAIDMRFGTKHRNIFLYALALAALLLLMKWLQWTFLIRDNSIEIYIGLIALIFTGLGIWVAMKLTNRRTHEVIVEKPVYISPDDTFVRDEQALSELGLSTRELEVLSLMAEGYSNAEIGEALFVSLSTVKTHSSNLFRKLDVQRRTQAIEKAKRLKIIA